MAVMILKRGQIWWVNLGPAVGSEIQKKRPCVIVNTDAAGLENFQGLP